MHRLMLLLAVLLPVAGHAGIRAAAPDDIANQYFQIACELSKLNCEGIDAPVVLVIDTPNHIQGFHYRGTNIVFVTDRCFSSMADLIKCDAVVIHEIVHYINSELNIRPESCENEASAWAAYDAYVKSRGRPDLVLGDNWRRGYPQCQEKSQ